MTPQGQPEYIEQEIAALLRRNETSAGPSASTAARLHGKDLLSMAGEYHTELITAGLARFVRAAMPELELSGVDAQAASLEAIRQRAAELLGAPVPPRPPTFCVGCPERPVFSALKQVRQAIGPMHVSSDIGCHSFATFAPFSMGNSIQIGRAHV